MNYLLLATCSSAVMAIVVADLLNRWERAIRTNSIFLIFSSQLL